MRKNRGPLGGARRWAKVWGLAGGFVFFAGVGFPCVSDFSAGQTQWDRITYRWTNGCSNPLNSALFISVARTDPLMVEGFFHTVPVSYGIYNSFDVYPNTALKITVSLLGSTTTFPSVTLTTLASPPVNIHAPLFKFVDSRSISLQWESGWPGFNGNPLDTLYEVEMSTEPTFAHAMRERKIFPTIPQTTTFDCLEPEMTYFTRIRAISRAGIPTEYGVNASTRTLPLSSPPSSFLWEDGLWALTPQPGDLTVEHHVQFSNSPSETPLLSPDLPNRIQTANAKMGEDMRRRPLPGGLVEIRANRMCPSEFDIALSHPATLQFRYFESGGMVDTGRGLVQSSSLSFYRLDERMGIWNKIPSRVEGGQVTANVKELGTLAVMGQQATSLEDVQTRPNPFHLRDNTGVTFANMAESATLHLYTPSGREVRRLEETDGDGLLVWDGRATSGDMVDPGVYFYTLKSPGDEKRGKVMVLP